MRFFPQHNDSGENIIFESTVFYTWHFLDINIEKTVNSKKNEMAKENKRKTLPQLGKKKMAILFIIPCTATTHDIKIEMVVLYNFLVPVRIKSFATPSGGQQL
jgi:hypothetical protein